ncbi:hypothetical protein D5039_06915 [Verminephrobacter aporrectodeae subsp. tuberculatae]|uniref:Uncharacterized protein n=3 Tax=Verminephrobacter TaxID=364316 RepID=A0ABT3KRG7_9BURK|nr:hypothetical protein [Verminephrobacter aporrectodeae subsp. tuberculatae]MCW5320901.1 hypothetical protein [Verminephrobacter aporrectodeae subsp. tuberculatae]
MIFVGYLLGLSIQRLLLIAGIMLLNLIVLHAKTDSVFFERLTNWFGLSPEKTRNVVDFVGHTCLVLLVISGSSANASR